MEFNSFKDKLFKMAEKEGFTEYEIYFVNADSFKVSVYEKEIDNYSVNTTRGLGFRGIYNDRMGYAYTEVLDEDAISLLVRNARSNATIIENDDKEVIYSRKDTYAKVESYNNDLSMVSAEDKIKLAMELEKLTLQQDPRVKSVKYCGVQSFDETVNIVNSNGLDLSYRVNGIYAVLVPVIKDGDRMNTAVAIKATSIFDDIKPHELVKEAVDNAVAYIGAAPVESGKYRIALKNDAAADLLDTFSGIFSADAVQKGLSMLKGKVGELIGSQSLTIIDDPLMKGGLASSPFDAEGVACRTKEVVKDGKLLTLLYNLKTALKDGVDSTGNAYKGSYSSTVSIAPSNFYIKPGEKSLDDILAEVGDGLFITELQGLHSGTNPISGDFSLAAKGFVVESGKLGRPVEQITIAGNFFKLLFDIESVASDLKFGTPSGGCYGSPTILISEISVAG